MSIMLTVINQLTNEQIVLQFTAYKNSQDYVKFKIKTHQQPYMEIAHHLKIIKVEIFKDLDTFCAYTLPVDNANVIEFMQVIDTTLNTHKYHSWADGYTELLLHMDQIVNKCGINSKINYSLFVNTII